MNFTRKVERGRGRTLVALLPVTLMLLSSCFLAERDNPNDPASSDYKVTASVTPAAETVIAGHEPITVKFDEAIDKATVDFTGSDLIAGNYVLTWSTGTLANDTLLISADSDNPKAFLPAGEGKKIVINAKTEGGVKLSDPVTLTYDVENRIYVRTSDDGGDDGNIGTSEKPVATIQKGITLADSIYSVSSSGTASAKVLVAEGTYTNVSDTTKPVVDMVERISVYGGYSKTDWTQRNVSDDGATSTYETIIEDKCTSGGSKNTPTYAVYLDSTINRSTILDGFTIKQGIGRDTDGSHLGYGHAAIFCEGSPTVRYNNFPGRTLSENPGNFSISIYCSINAPLITNNKIYAGANAGDETVGTSDYNLYSIKDASFGVYANNSSALIQNNLINGGSGFLTYGIYCYGDSIPVISQNAEIACGSGCMNGLTDSTTHDGAYCIYIRGSSPEIESNTIINALGNSNGWGVYEYNSGTSNPSILSNNHFSSFSVGYLYCDDGNYSSPVQNYSTVITLTSSVTGTLASWNNDEI